MADCAAIPPLPSSWRCAARVSACCDHLSSAAEFSPRRLIASLSLFPFPFRFPFVGFLCSLGATPLDSTHRSGLIQSADHSAATSEADSLCSPHSAQLSSAMSHHATARQRRGRGAAAGDAEAARDDSPSATADATANADPIAATHADTQRLIVDVETDDEESRAAAAGSHASATSATAAAAASPSRPQRRAAAEASGRLRALAFEEVGQRGDECAPNAAQLPLFYGCGLT